MWICALFFAGRQREKKKNHSADNIELFCEATRDDVIIIIKIIYSCGKQKPCSCYPFRITNRLQISFTPFIFFFRTFVRPRSILYIYIHRMYGNVSHLPPFLCKRLFSFFISFFHILSTLCLHWQAASCLSVDLYKFMRLYVLD